MALYFQTALAPAAGSGAVSMARKVKPSAAVHEDFEGVHAPFFQSRPALGGEAGCVAADAVMRLSSRNREVIDNARLLIFIGRSSSEWVQGVRIHGNLTARQNRQGMPPRVLSVTGKAPEERKTSWSRLHVRRLVDASMR